MKDKMSNRLFSTALWELMGLGFIDRVREGRLERECSIYRLSNRWRKLENEPKTLDEVESLLKKVEDLKREKGSVEKRIRIKELRIRALKLSGIRKV